MDAQCSERVWSQSAFHGSPCRNKAKVERDGRSYCGIHDPEVSQARRTARSAKWQAQEAAQRTVQRGAETLALRLGVGRPAWGNGTGGAQGFYYTGGLTLTAKDVEQLLKELGRP